MVRAEQLIGNAARPTITSGVHPEQPFFEYILIVPRVKQADVYTV